MKNVLWFFIPKILPSVIKIFAIFLGLALLIKLLPLDERVSGLLEFIILFIGFPLTAFFDKKTYVPSSNHWLLLTPVKKRHIYFTHIVINTLKTSLILSFSIGAFIILTPSSEQVSTGVGSASEWNDLVLTNRIMTFFFCSLFFMTPIFGYLTTDMREKLQKLEHRTLSPRSKSILWFFVVIILTFTAVVMNISQENNSYASLFLVLPLILCVLMNTITIASLHSLKISHSKIKISVGFMTFTAVMVYSFLLHNQIFVQDNPKISAAGKIEDSLFMGSFSDALDEDIIKSLHQESILVSSSELKLFLNKVKDNPGLIPLKESLVKDCLGDEKRSCRVVSYLTKDLDEKVDYLKKGCPSDIKACLEGSSIKSSSQGEFFASVNEYCASEDNGPEKKRYCRSWRGMASK